MTTPRTSSRTALWAVVVLWVLAFLVARPAAADWGLGVTDPPAGQAQKGAAIAQVAPNSPAAAASLRVGDVITRCQGLRVRSAAEFVDLVGRLAPDESLRLSVARSGWEKEVRLTPKLGAHRAPEAPAQAEPRAGADPDVASEGVSFRIVERTVETYTMRGGSPTEYKVERIVPGAGPIPETPVRRGAPTPAVAVGPGKPVVAVGDFQVKAASATRAIGDGLREMLVTALHNTGAVTVVERMDLPGVAAEQALSRSRMAAAGAAVPEAAMDVAQVYVYGAVTEFEPQAGGSSFYNPGTAKLPVGVGTQISFSTRAIDVRVVDAATGKVLAATRIPGAARAARGSVGVAVTAGGLSLPVGLEAYRSTPMEEAIRDCIQKAALYVVNNVPEEYLTPR